MSPGPGRRFLSKCILSGDNERIFAALPQRVIDNLRHPTSENALVWNQLYPLAQPRLALRSLLSLRPLWGTAPSGVEEDALEPCFWGYNLSGERLGGLDEVLVQVDGPRPQTEVDLFLLGARHLILVEAKHMGGLGRCKRYASGRCPEIHAEEGVERQTCRYWEAGEGEFEAELEFGGRPTPDTASPMCDRHYQLSRTLLAGRGLERRKGLALHLWLITPRAQWANLERDWMDFTERVRHADLWRRMRVLAWEDVARLPRV